MCIDDLSGCNLVALASLVSISISEGLSSSEIPLVDSGQSIKHKIPLRTKNGFPLPMFNEYLRL